MIRSITNKTQLPIEVDLTGPDGNAFSLIGMVYKLGNLLNERRGAEYLNTKAIVVDMMSGDYNHLIKVIEKNFGDYIIMYK